MIKDHSFSLTEKLQAYFWQGLPGRKLSLQPLPLVPEISLMLVDPLSMSEPLTHEEAQAAVAEPAYWSFCWASGQVLARWILDNAGQVSGRRVLDVGSGSGVVAIAAAMVGAAEVVACDCDSGAGLAIAANAAAMGVRVDWQRELPAQGAFDLITAADILYDADNRPLLQQFRGLAAEVWLADSRVRNLEEPGYTLWGQGEAITWPDLGELAEFRQVRLYRSGEAG